MRDDMTRPLCSVAKRLSWIQRFRLSTGRCHLRYSKKMITRVPLEREEAVRLARRFPFYLGSLGYVYGRAGREKQALALLHELEEILRQQHVSPYWVGLIHASLHNTDAAFRCLKRANPQSGGYQTR